MRVMLIEDDALVRRMISEALDDEGMEVDGLASAEDAMVLLGAGQVPDVLVADANLGSGLSGSDLASIARERHPGVEVVLISGQPIDDAGTRSPLGRRERFLRKPFRPEALTEAIRQAAADAAAAPSPG
jgi:DNA-binding NtrC family response regulator